MKVDGPGSLDFRAAVDQAELQGIQDFVGCPGTADLALNRGIRVFAVYRGIQDSLLLRGIAGFRLEADSRDSVGDLDFLGTADSRDTLEYQGSAVSLELEVAGTLDSAVRLLRRLDTLVFPEVVEAVIPGSLELLGILVLLVQAGFRDTRVFVDFPVTVVSLLLVRELRDIVGLADLRVIRASADPQDTAGFQQQVPEQAGLVGTRDLVVNRDIPGFADCRDTAGSARLPPVHLDFQVTPGIQHILDLAVLGEYLPDQ